MFDMMKMMGKVKEAQEKMKEAQAELAGITAEGSSGGDMVTVTANGLKQVLKIEIDDLVAEGGDKQMMSDLIVAATNNALDNVSVLAQEHLQKATEGMLPNIPGFDLGSMMK